MSDTNRLTLRYTHDASFFEPKLVRDDFGSLTVSVQTDSFSGKAHFWVQWQDLVEFGERLATYPIPPDAPIAEQWGYEMQEGEDLIVRLEIAAQNARGGLTAKVELADRFEPWQRVRASFGTEYPALDWFRRDIARLMAGEIDEAVLVGR